MTTTNQKISLNNCTHEQGETEIWERVLRAINDLKSEVGGIRRLLAKHGITHEDPPRKSNQQGSAGNEGSEVQEPEARLIRWYSSQGQA